jgi:dipeptidyl aminopeptidase/acylaminoacyl peptidase
MMMRTWTALGRKRAVPAVLLVTGLAWMISGCIEESPIAVSPDGKMLAFVTVEPYPKNDDPFASGVQAFRLMLVDNDGKIRVLEESVDAMLSGPVFHPDGKKIAYLRMTLPSAAQAGQRQKDLEHRLEDLKKVATPRWQEWASSQTQPARAGEIADIALPPVKSQLQGGAWLLVASESAATLIVRDIEKGTILSRTAIELPAAGPGDLYKYVRPQYDPSGEFVYLAAASLALKVCPGTGEIKTLSLCSPAAPLSPDGKWVASWQDDVVSMTATDGSQAVYRRLPIHATPCTVNWIDNHTLAALQVMPAPTTTQPAATEPAEPASQTTWVLQRIRTDGTLLAATKIALPVQDGPANNTDQFCLSSDGAYMVISVSGALVFARMDGTVLATIHQDDIAWQHPIFTSDSKRVAAKLFTKDGSDSWRTQAIVFFSPEGKELNRVAIPPIAPGTTRPAWQPATQNAPVE